MKYLRAIFTLIAITFAFVSVSAAQKPPSMAADRVEKVIAKHPSVSDVVKGTQFSSDDGRFTIGLPRDVDAVAAVTPEIAGRNVSGGAFRWRVREGGVFINYYDYLDAGFTVTTEQEYAKFFADSRNALLTSLGATLLTERAITLGKYHGREFVFERDGGKRGFSRVYYVDKRNYTITALCDSAIGDAEVLLTRAFNTFALITPSKTAAAKP